jgi:hypothetical protein
VVVILCWACAIDAQEANSSQFWTPVDVKWKQVKGVPSKKMASAAVLYFGENGEFVKDECWLIKEGDFISVSNGDPHNESVGLWEPIADGMHVTYRMVRRTIERKGEVLPGKKISADIGMTRVGLEFGDRVFRRTQLANANDYVASYNSLVRESTDK